MADIPVNPVPAEPTPPDSAAKKTTTRLIPLPLTDDRPGSDSSLKTGSPQPPGDAASKNKRDNMAPIGNIPTTAPQTTPAGAPPPDRKMQTMRIELDEALSSPHSPIDRKNVTMPISELLPTEPSAPDSIDRKNITMPISEIMTTKVPPAKSIDQKNVTMPIPDFMSTPPSSTSKTGGRDNASKKTTRIDLAPVPDNMPSKETKRSTSPITVIPQTIRLKRTSGLTQAMPPSPKSQPDPINEAPTLGRMPDLSQAKMVTARILVEPNEPEDISPAEGKRKTSVISTAPATEPTPKTIHLKRPSATSLEEPGLAERTSEAPTVTKTMEEPPGHEEAGPTTITQRKTIKIKRTEHNVAAPRTVKMRQPDSIAGVTPGVMGQAPGPAEEDAPSPVFFAMASVAAVLIACLVYFMAAQALGPELVLPVPSSLL